MKEIYRQCGYCRRRATLLQIHSEKLHNRDHYLWGWPPPFTKKTFLTSLSIIPTKINIIFFIILRYYSIRPIYMPGPAFPMTLWAISNIEGVLKKRKEENQTETPFPLWRIILWVPKSMFGIFGLRPRRREVVRGEGRGIELPTGQYPHTTNIK